LDAAQTNSNLETSVYGPDYNSCKRHLKSEIVWEMLNVNLLNRITILEFLLLVFLFIIAWKLFYQQVLFITV